MINIKSQPYSKLNLYWGSEFLCQLNKDDVKWLHKQLYFWLKDKGLFDKFKEGSG